MDGAESLRCTESLYDKPNSFDNRSLQYITGIHGKKLQRNKIRMSVGVCLFTSSGLITRNKGVYDMTYYFVTLSVHLYLRQFRMYGADIL